MRVRLTSRQDLIPLFLSTERKKKRLRLRGGCFKVSPLYRGVDMSDVSNMMVLRAWLGNEGDERGATKIIHVVPFHIMAVNCCVFSRRLNDKWFECLCMRQIRRNKSKFLGERYHRCVSCGEPRRALNFLVKIDRGTQVAKENSWGAFSDLRDPSIAPTRTLSEYEL
jgi:hypothetical protein